jgi:hypothetical protein
VIAEVAGVVAAETGAAVDVVAEAGVEAGGAELVAGAAAL